MLAIASYMLSVTSIGGRNFDQGHIRGKGMLISSANVIARRSLACDELSYMSAFPLSTA